MHAVSLAQADSIIHSVLAESCAQSLPPMTVVVLDPGGHIVCCKRQDGSGILRVEVATAKAYGALGFGFGSRGFAGRPLEFLAAAAVASGGRLVPVPGGVLIRSAEGACMGAVGVSGDTSDADERVAVAGIRAAGLIAQAAAPATPP